MLKNNNQPAVKRLGIRALQQNRTRNLFAILAIILTTFMFTTVFSIGFSLAKNMNTMLLRQQGSKTTIMLQQPSREQQKQAEKAKNLNAAGIQVLVSTVTDKTGEKKIFLNYYNKTEFQENFSPAISDVNGSYPKKEQELMLSKAALDALEIRKPKRGMGIILLSEGKELHFTLSGWFTDYITATGGFPGLVSEAYMRKQGLSVEKDGWLCLSAKVGRQGALLEELEDLVTLRDGQKFDSSYDMQDENIDTAVVIAVAIGFMGMIIILSGYLLIYNVMYISVTKDIRFYGMLKTIGTSPSQIKKLVKMQTKRLSVLGIPIGILLGTLVSFGMVPYALEMFGNGMSGVMPKEISFNPLIYIGTILFAVITVTISCRKPAKLASKVSAVEALKYNGQLVKAKAKKSTGGGKIYKMAFRNVFRERKRAILVFASLFMGTMAFLTVDTFLGSMKLDNYVDYYLPNDFTIFTYSGIGDNTTEEEKSYQQEANKLIEDIARLDGITHLSVNHSADYAILRFDEKVFAPFMKNEFEEGKELQEAIDFYKNATDEERAYAGPVISVSKEMIENYNKRASQKMDLERFEEGEICLVGFVNTKEQAEEVRGKRITLIDNTSKKELELEVGACPLRTESMGINIGYYWQKGGAPSCILISEKAMNRFCKNTSIDNIIVDCEADAEPLVRKEIVRMTKVNTAVLQTEIKSEMTADFQSSMSAMNILGGGISIVLILIGVINFINVMMTGVFTRRVELAVMESVGMTKKQIRKMLCMEGMYYGVLSIVLILTIGNVIIYMIANLARQIADYAVFYYPVALMCCIAAAILGICIAIPSIVYHTLSKESVTERLRSGE